MIQLKDIINYLDKTATCKIYQGDTFTTKNEWEEVFDGAVMDIPWGYLDYWLTNDPEGEAISSFHDEKGRVVMSINLCENRCRSIDYKEGDLNAD